MGNIRVGPLKLLLLKGGVLTTGIHVLTKEPRAGVVVLRRKRQENQEFNIVLGNTVRLRMTLTIQETY